MAEKMTLDFSQVKDASAFNPKRKTEGEYLGTVVSFSDTKSKADKAMWVFGVALKSDRRAVYPVYCLLGPDQVWKLRNMMLAAGFKVPKKRMNVDGNRMVGKDIGIFLEDDEYEGKPKSVIGSFFPPDEYTGPDASDESDEEEPEEEEYEDDTVAEEDEEESADETDEEDSDEDDDSEDEDEQDEEPEPAPKKAAAARTKAPGRARTKKPEPVEEDEDEMDVEEL